MPARNVPLEVRFSKKYAAADNGCWIWFAAKDRDGYGCIQVSGRKERAHRIAWEMVHGPVPAGMLVCHRCDTPSCVNPAHLFLGTITDNNWDKVRKGRGAVGEMHGRAKLNRDAVSEIRRLSATELHQSLATRFGVSKSLIGQIVNGEIWRAA